MPDRAMRLAKKLTKVILPGPVIIALGGIEKAKALVAKLLRDRNA